MCPRQVLPTPCEHGEYEQFETESGLLMGAYICHHPDREGCWCTINEYACAEGTCPVEEPEQPLAQPK